MSETDLPGGAEDTTVRTDPDTTAEAVPLVVTVDVDGTPVDVLDLTGDGALDTALAQLPSGAVVAVGDENGDQVPDVLAVDADGDGIMEVQVTRDGDTYLLARDDDGDGVFDPAGSVTRSELEAQMPEVAAFLDLSFADLEQAVADGSGTGTQPWSVEDGVLVGDPTGAAEHWFWQAQNGFCVPAAIAQIVSEYTGVHHTDEAAFVETANQLGLFVVGMDGVPGMLPEGALALLESSGVPAALVSGASVDMLADYLAAGQSVMLFVDSGEYWYGESEEDYQMDHAVVLTGIDAERGVAILSDPGTPDGNALEVPLDVLEDAWADGGNTVLICEEPAPAERAPAPPTDVPAPPPTEVPAPALPPELAVPPPADRRPGRGGGRRCGHLPGRVGRPPGAGPLGAAARGPRRGLGHRGAVTSR